MCGICGIFGEIDEQLIHRMTRTMNHRGPDGEGYFIDPKGSVSLGMRRLSIIDLDTGWQPIHNEDETVWIVFNGEIYNYRELRASLESKGHHFYTHSDTEVIVHLYEEYGEACVHALRGMFAFAIYDRRGMQGVHDVKCEVRNSSETGRLFVARDRLGIKPLYYAEVNSGLAFASEIKALLEHPSVPREVDLEALDFYLTLQYVPGPHTMFRGIYKLPPGHTLLWENGRAKIDRYWDIAFDGYQGPLSEREATFEFRRLLEESVGLHLIADVPLGALLSGGIDSGAIVGWMSQLLEQPVQTFTVGFDIERGYNELEEARGVAEKFGTDHHEVVLNAPTAQELLPKIVWHLDEPIADRAALPTYLICEYARQFVTMALTGEGGDELLGGYPRYRWFRLAKSLQKWLPKSLRSILETFPGASPRKKRALLAELTDAQRHIAWIGNFDEPEKNRLYSAEMKAHLQSVQAQSMLNPEPLTLNLVSRYLDAAGSEDLIHRLMYLDMKTWLVDDILTKVDKMSMAASLEARVPLLDHKVVEFVTALPSRMKVRGRTTKYLLRQTLNGFLPDSIIRGRKHAFEVPAAEWFRGGLRGFAEELLLSGSSQRRGYFDLQYVRWMLEEHFEGRRDFNQPIWNLLCLELWHRIYLDRDVSCS